MKILRPIQYFALCRILLCGHAYNTVDGSSWLSFVIALSSASCGGADGGACEVGMGTGSFGWLEGGGPLGAGIILQIGLPAPNHPITSLTSTTASSFYCKAHSEGTKNPCMPFKGTV